MHHEMLLWPGRDYRSTPCVALSTGRRHRPLDCGAMAIKSVGLGDDVDDNRRVLWKERFVVYFLPFKRFAHLREGAPSDLIRNQIARVLDLV